MQERSRSHITSAIRNSCRWTKTSRPLSFAVPRGAGGVFERLFAGDIDWKAALVWLMLKLHSDWTTGITDKNRMATLAKWVGFSKQTVCDAIKTLQEAGMLKRLSEKWECSVFQLYPKPYEKRAVRKREKRQAEKSKSREMRADGEWRYSFNELYRLNVEYRRDTDTAGEKSRALAAAHRPRTPSHAESHTHRF